MLGIVEGVLFTALGLLGVAGGLLSLRLPTFPSEVLSPGRYQVAISAVLSVLGVVYLIGHWPRPRPPRLVIFPPEPAPSANPDRPGPALQLLIAVAGYAVLIPVLGYVLASLAFFPAVTYLFGVRPWWRAGVAGVAFTAVFYLGMVTGATVTMPRGLVGRLLG